MFEWNLIVLARDRSPAKNKKDEGEMENGRTYVRP